MPDSDSPFSALLADLHAVLKKHDAGAFFVLARPPRAEVGYHLEATWSCASLDEGEFCLTVPPHLPGSPEARLLPDTLAMLSAFHQVIPLAQQDVEGMITAARVDFTAVSRTDPPPAS